jgi:2Fe-2S ferredoxin
VVKITYIEANGAEHAVDVPVGWSVMEGAVKNGIPGILADCGGSCACGTCRVYVPEEWRAKTGKSHDMEDATIEVHDDQTPGKRLGCQIKVSADLDGLVVRMPARQF